MRIFCGRSDTFVFYVGWELLDDQMTGLHDVRFRLPVVIYRDAKSLDHHEFGFVHLQNLRIHTQTSSTTSAHTSDVVARLYAGPFGCYATETTQQVPVRAGLGSPSNGGH